MVSPCCFGGCRWQNKRGGIAVITRFSRGRRGRKICRHNRAGRDEVTQDEATVCVRVCTRAHAIPNGIFNRFRAFFFFFPFTTPCRLLCRCEPRESVPSTDLDGSMSTSQIRSMTIAQVRFTSFAPITLSKCRVA